MMKNDVFLNKCSQIDPQRRQIHKFPLFQKLFLVPLCGPDYEVGAAQLRIFLKKYFFTSSAAGQPLGAPRRRESVRDGPRACQGQCLASLGPCRPPCDPYPIPSMAIGSSKCLSAVRRRRIPETVLTALRHFDDPMAMVGMEGVGYGSQGGRQGLRDAKHCP